MGVAGLSQLTSLTLTGRWRDRCPAAGRPGDRRVPTRLGWRVGTSCGVAGAEVPV